MRTAVGFWPLMAWAVLVLASWFGWGAALAWGVRRRRPAGRRGRRPAVDAGLCTAWGMAFSVLLGGVMNATRACSYASIGAVVGVGVVLALPRLWRAGLRWFVRVNRAPAAALLPVVPLVLYGAVVLGGGLNIEPPYLNFFDDSPLYMVMPQKMLQSGALLDPLNKRRMGTYGGYAFLQAEMGVFAEDGHPFAVEVGLMPMVLALLLAGPLRRRAQWRMAVVTTLAVWLYPMQHFNSTAEWSVTVALVAMLRSVLLADRRAYAADRRRLLLVAALCAVAAASFRANLLAVPPVFFLLYFAGRWRRTRRPVEAFGELATVVVAGGLMILPWSVLLWQGSGTPLFPTWPGHAAAGMAGFVGSTTPRQRVSIVAGVLVALPLVVLYLPNALLLIGRQWQTLCLTAATFVGVVLTVWSYPTADQTGWQRYCLPALVAPALVAVRYGLHARVGRWRFTGPIVAVTLWVLALFCTGGPLPWATVWGQFQNAGTAASRPAVPFMADLREPAAAMQRALPPGAVIATAMEGPTVLDFGRNPVWTLDIPGDTAITGAWPVGIDPIALKTFLAAQGIDYVCWADFDTSDGMYSSKIWFKRLLDHDDNAPHVLDFMAAMERLRHTAALAYAHDGFYAVKVR